ncbi:hypothetical protein B0H16DRAFT_1467973 [Mycena metata]|uniref:Uncharacterized protein n=1 Tax=Mycena metata TaxID=1033252 RepID=A0AAD7MV69_9AGAR|nr:hypothetical protein B0H16DRAFT_1467973 [Mycena metata]
MCGTAASSSTYHTSFDGWESLRAGNDLISLALMSPWVLCLATRHHASLSQLEQVTAPVQPPTLSGPMTRTGNKLRRPGIDTGYRKEWTIRRTPEEIAIAKQEEDSAKRHKKAEQKRLISAAASISA